MAVDNKKPELYTIEPNPILCRIIKIFYYLGIWQSEEGSINRTVGKKFCFVAVVVLFAVFIAANAFLCDDRDESIFSIQAAVLVAVLFVKCLYLVFKQKEILEFLGNPILAHSTRDGEEYKKINRVIAKLMKFVRGYDMMIVFTATINVIIQLPIFSADKALPLFISFSWQSQHSEIIYWFAFVLMTLGFISAYVANLTNILIWYIMLNYSIGYKVLGNKLKKLGRATTAKGIKKKTRNSRILKIIQESSFIENIISLIKEHQNLTKTVERFRNCFSNLFLAQITTSGINICVSVFNLAYASADNIVQTQLFIAILLYAVFNIFIVMYLANEITDASGRLSYCLFESNWMEQTEKCKKYVIIMGEVLKQPQQLVILIYPMNLDTFTRIVNGAYTMFNILKSFN